MEKSPIPTWLILLTTAATLLGQTPPPDDIVKRFGADKIVYFQCELLHYAELEQAATPGAPKDLPGGGTGADNLRLASHYHGYLKDRLLTAVNHWDVRHQGRIEFRKSAHFMLVPVADIHAFAKSLDFCTVKQVENQTIHAIVDLKKFPPLPPDPPANADGITKALVTLQDYGNEHLRLEALRYLAQVRADASRRADVVKGVLPFLRHWNFVYRERATLAIGTWGARDQIPAIEEMAANADPVLGAQLRKVADSAIRAIKQRKDVVSTPATSKSKPIDVDKATAAELGAALPTAANQVAILTKLKETRGVEYSTALADAIPKLAGSFQEQARDALAERFARLTVRSLRAYLDEKKGESCLAAIRAAASKQATDLIPDLIPLVGQDDIPLAVAANKALHELMGERVPLANPNDLQERQFAMERWRFLWEMKRKP